MKRMSKVDRWSQGAKASACRQFETSSLKREEQERQLRVLG